MEHEGCTGAASLWRATLDEKRESGEILYDLCMEENKADDVAHPYVVLHMPVPDDRPAPDTDERNAPPNFRQGDSVVLYERNADTDDVTNHIIFKGNIEWITDTGLCIRLRMAQRNTAVLPAGSRYAVEHDSMDTAFRGMYRGLAAFLQATQERRDLLLGVRPPQTDVSFRPRIAAATDDFERITLKAQAARDYFLLVGPPGTGKTSRALRGMVEAFLREGKQILLLSYTNRAVDEICKALSNITPAVSFMRIGSELSCEEAYRPHLAEEMLKDCPNRRAVQERIAGCSIFVGTVATLTLSEEDPYYIDYGLIDNIYFMNDGKSFLYVSERDGYRHVYRYRMNGLLDKQLTSGPWDVTAVYGYDEKTGTLYYQAAEASPMQRDVYALDAKGRTTRLTDGRGMHQATFNSTFTNFIDNGSTTATPNRMALRTNKGKELRVLEDNAALASTVQELDLPRKEFFQFTTSEGVTLNGWMVRPADFDTAARYPLLLVQYSGPDSQEVLDSWSIGWEYYLAQQGYVVACVDGRGTGARGAEFRKCTYRRLGTLEVRDQIEAARYLGMQPGIDPQRIGIWGWSYGGFMTLMCMSAPDSPFKAGIAVAPVTDWRLYDAAYTERFMRRPQENFTGYDAASPLLRADSLQGRLLIVHGTADDNVHVQNTMLYVSRLVEAGKQFEMQIYPDKNHSILGKQTRRHLYTRKCDFLFNNL